MHNRVRLILWILLNLSFIISTAGANEMRFLPTPAPDTLFETYRDGQPIAPPVGFLALIGRLDAAGFSIEDINQIEAILPSGKTVPLIVDEKRTLHEFGKIVSLDFCLTAPKMEFSDKKSALMLRWGPEVTVHNESIGGFSIDQAKAEHYRMLIPQTSAYGEQGEAVTTGIQAIADKTASYIPLWYLLPMGLVFVILTIRKLADSLKN